MGGATEGRGGSGRGVSKYTGDPTHKTPLENKQNTNTHTPVSVFFCKNLTYLEERIHVTAGVHDEGFPFVGDEVSGLRQAFQIEYLHLEPAGLLQDALQTSLQGVRGSFLASLLAIAPRARQFML